MAGKVSPIEGITPKPQMRQVISYEQSPMFARNSAERYNPDELASRKGLRVYRQMMTDEQVKAVMNFKRDAITARGWQFSYPSKGKEVDDQSKERIRVMTRIVQLIRGSFEDSINCVALGRQYGFSMTEMVLDNVTIDGKKWIGIHSLLMRDPTTFSFVTDRYGTLEKVVQKIGADEIDINISKFIHYVQAPEEDRYYGQSDLRQAYRAWYIKDQVIRLYATFLERFAGGFAVMSLTPESGIVPGSREHTDLQDILSNMRNLAGILLPPGVTIDLAKPNTTEEYREALTYLDLAIAKSLLVPNLLGLSHNGQTGSFSQSQTQLEAFFWTLAADTRRLEACLNEQLFRRIGDMNWGDGDYPIFQFKPANSESVKWLVTMWKDLVGARAVTTTEEDEDYLRGLLEMPARLSEDAGDEDEKGDPDPYTSLDGSQIKGMLDILSAVGTGTIPKDTAVGMLLRSFPITEEQAKSMVEPIEVKEPVLLTPQVGPGGESTPPAPGGPPSRGIPQKPGAAPPKVVAHTEDGQPRLVSMDAFQSAVSRVNFAVIDKKATTLSDDVVEQLSRLVARAVRRSLGPPERLADLLGTDVTVITEMRLDGADVGRVKAAFRDMLTRAWAMGLTDAKSELSRTGKPSATEFADLRDRAAEYFEANAFRLAANVSDGTRAVIQQHLIQGIKQGMRADDVAAAIYASLTNKGFTTLDAIERETADLDLIEKVREALDLKQNVNVAAYLATLARTNIFEAMNEARFAEFTDPALEGYVVAFEYSAILDSRTTEICRELDGKVFTAGSPEWNMYRPPNHYNCRSLLIPITEIDGWDGISSSLPTIKPADGFGG